jgi:hypothetical protein
MTNEAIAKFVENGHLIKSNIKIDFKQRSSLIGMFLKANDYEELKSKNFWRIVTDPKNIEAWKKSKDMNLARLFNGMEITKLSEVKEKALAK